ncbi:glucosamine-6-phosphate deaminase [Haloplasma contractile]|uniref:Glucosamine-6-phosphate deaminase n=1 Tax=Haloplasma contractile SSD-17B TaxID=1033810 RepID=U2EFG7_9MOLU|nr:glucosamine-6-phosphate deaminase [Haloplasma contractile]ERJ13678.1 Glucosamine-6-phosphate deaminase protein [Haloplasma contractile SSD-17B]
MKVEICNTYEEISKKAAAFIIEQVNQVPNSVIGFATGSSPIGLYKELVRDYRENATSYKDVISFNLDEYFGINKDNDQSYYYFMKTHLFKHIDIKKEHIHIPSGDSEDVLEECEFYNKKLAEHIVDIQILGIGSNGHIGFNEPGTPFDQKTHVIELDEKTRQDNARFFNSYDEVPQYAVTMGIKNILQARKILLIATGEKKADAVKRMIEGPETIDLPASALQSHPDVTVLVDYEAASMLSQNFKKSS